MPDQKGAASAAGSGGPLDTWSPDPLSYATFDDFALPKGEASFEHKPWSELSHSNQQSADATPPVVLGLYAEYIGVGVVLVDFARLWTSVGNACAKAASMSRSRRRLSTQHLVRNCAAFLSAIWGGGRLVTQPGSPKPSAVRTPVGIEMPSLIQKLGAAEQLMAAPNHSKQQLQEAHTLMRKLSQAASKGGINIKLTLSKPLVSCLAASTESARFFFLSFSFFICSRIREDAERERER